MFTAAFDASGTDGTTVLTVAGFVSSPNGWDEFSRQWESRLAEDGIKYFHAVEFAHSTGQFTGWKNQEAKRRKLLNDLMHILRASVYRKFGCCIVNATFASLDQSLREEFLLNAYSVAGRTCERHLREWARWDGIRGPIESVYEDGDIGKGKLQQRLSLDLGYTPVFKPKKDKMRSDGTIIERFVPLQAADWLAYELSLVASKYGQGSLTGRLNDISELRWPMQQFLTTIRGEPQIYSPDNLKELEKNIRLHQELAAWWEEHQIVPKSPVNLQ